jgi:hypothetical protein
MTRALALLGCALAALVAGAGDARATNECRGLMVCVPVAGPWVVVPATSRRVQYQLACPPRYIVGGLDAELSHRAIELSFPGLLGSPVNPGITTSANAVFAAFYTGTRGQVTTFRPHIGCIPAAGGGGGAPPAFAALRPAAFPPGRPTVRRVRTVRAFAERTTRGVHGCRRNERLVGATHAVGLFTRTAPANALASAVSVTRTVRSGRIRVTVRGSSTLRGVNAIVQIQAVCAGTGQ